LHWHIYRLPFFTSNQSFLKKAKRLIGRAAASGTADALNIKKGTPTDMNTRLCDFAMAIFIFRTP